LDIAEHTILLKGFPRNIPKLELERNVRSIIEEILKIDKIEDESQIVKVISTSDMSKCHTWYTKLNKLDGEYQLALQTNAKNDLTKRLSIMLKGKCCGQTEVDAIEYYEEKIEALKK